MFVFLICLCRNTYIGKKRYVTIQHYTQTRIKVKEQPFIAAMHFTVTVGVINNEHSLYHKISVNGPQCAVEWYFLPTLILYTIITNTVGWFVVFNVTFNNISVISGCQFYWWSKPQYLEKTTHLCKSLTNFIT